MLMLYNFFWRCRHTPAFVDQIYCERTRLLPWLPHTLIKHSTTLNRHNCRSAIEDCLICMLHSIPYAITFFTESNMILVPETLLSWFRSNSFRQNSVWPRIRRSSPLFRHFPGLSLRHTSSVPTDQEIFDSALCIFRR